MPAIIAVVIDHIFAGMARSYQAEFSSSPDAGNASSRPEPWAVRQASSPLPILTERNSLIGLIDSYEPDGKKPLNFFRGFRCLGQFRNMCKGDENPFANSRPNKG